MKIFRILFISLILLMISTSFSFLSGINSKDVSNNNLSETIVDIPQEEMVTVNQVITSPEHHDANYFYTIGEFNVDVDQGTKVHVIGYVRKMELEQRVPESAKQKTIIKSEAYRYELVLLSKSTFQFENTSTWLYGVRIFINQQDITAVNYPNNNYTLLIPTTPKTIFWMNSSDDMVLMEIMWNNAIYDPRKVK